MLTTTRVVTGAGAPHQRQVALVQGAHGRHEADRARHLVAGPSHVGYGGDDTHARNCHKGRDPRLTGGRQAGVSVLGEAAGLVPHRLVGPTDEFGQRRLVHGEGLLLGREGAPSNVVHVLSHGPRDSHPPGGRTDGSAWARSRGRGPGSRGSPAPGRRSRARRRCRSSAPTRLEVMIWARGAGMVSRTMAIGAGLLQRARVVEEADGGRGRLALYLKAAQLVHRLRRQPDVPHDGDADLDQPSHGLRHVGAALQLHGLGTRLLETRGRRCAGRPQSPTGSS